MLQGSPPANQLQNEHHKGDQKQNVNVSAQHVEADEAKQPENQQDYKDSPKHKYLSIEVVDLRSFGHAQLRVTKVGR